MKSLLKIMLTLALVFASTFVVVKLTGALSVEKIELLLMHAQTVSPWYIALTVIGLLFVDLFVAVPTLTIMILSGFFLGPILGFIASISGLFMSGLGGYSLSTLYGEKLSSVLIKDALQRAEAKAAFQRHGFVTILLSRALPILPEVSACMAGLTGMPFFRFLLAWSISVIPYAFIAAYAGSISSLENPKPAIFTAIALTTFFWACWFLFQRYQKRSVNNRPRENIVKN